MAKLDPNDQVSGNHYRMLCMHVGHLIISWASLESLLSGILKMHLGLNVEEDESKARGIHLASAVYGSQRYKSSADTINRILITETRNKVKEAMLGKVFAHVGNIGKLRDYFAHQQTSPASRPIDGTWRISTMFTAKDLNKMSFYEFETEAVAAATKDLIAALNLFGSQRPSSTLIDILIGDGASLPTWRYKPSMLRIVDLKSQNPLQEPEPPLQP